MVELILDRERYVQDIKDGIVFHTDTKSVQEFVTLHENGQLELAPAFQRQSVWSVKQRRDLIKSLYENVPIPSIFLYERYDNGRLVFDVIDGKQRLESIFMFLRAQGFRSKAFAFPAEWTENGDSEQHDDVTWHELTEREKHKLLSYPLQTITVKAAFPDIAEIFKRINSTGSKLTKQEIRTARFLNSDLLERCKAIANSTKTLNYLRANKILSQKQILRMKHVELVAELLVSMHYNAPQNKKMVIDEAMKKRALSLTQIERVSTEFSKTLGTLSVIFPRIAETRFTRVSDFYTLFLLVWKWIYVKKYVLSSKDRNELAEAYLRAFSHGVDVVSEKQRRLNAVTDEERPFADYLLTVKEGTDRIDQRQKREELLDGVFQGCFDQKDFRRSFSATQRRIVWAESNKRCSKCKAKLQPNRYHVDHIRAHARGGRTRLSNAQILCPKCNREKGAK